MNQQTSVIITIAKRTVKNESSASQLYKYHQEADTYSIIDYSSKILVMIVDCGTRDCFFHFRSTTDAIECNNNIYIFKILNLEFGIS